MTKKLPVITAPNPILRQKAIKVENFNDELREFLDQLEYTTVTSKNCGGLAANQVGYSQHAFIMNMDRDKKPYKMVNLEILKYSDKTCMWTEGCMSFPDIWLEIERPESVLVRYMDEFGKTHEEQFSGGEARNIQHELDHLNGILMIDTFSKDRQDFIMRKIKKTKPKV
ncbi:MAG: peptide deformylase [Alphaproteobacteria bacterium]|nr:MAG: peptide deformylase [Alphaproteobacteria bacterium]